MLDLSATSVEPGAVPPLILVADRAGRSDIGLFVVSPDGFDSSIHHVLAAADALDLFEIHPSIDSALRALND